MNHSICIISCYFGKLPEYFPLWVTSCKYNKDINFLLVTDQIVNINFKNIKVVNMSITQIEDLAKERVDKESIINKPYKLCDFKPTYGLLFKEYLDKYTFWGHCDLDLIFGDIRHFISDDVLENHDKILYLGHLSLYRNNEKINNSFKIGNNVYKEIFGSQKNFGFDEDQGIYRLMKSQGISIYEECIFADISPHYHRFKLSNLINKRMNKRLSVNYKNQLFFWNKGKVFRAFLESGVIKYEEYIYIHFQKRSMNFREFDAEQFYIGPYGFLEYEDEITIKEIKKINPYNLYRELIDVISYNFNSKIKNRIIYKIKLLNKIS